jgi:phasin family protein
MSAAKTTADKIANVGNEAVQDAMAKGMSSLNDMTSNARQSVDAAIASVTAAAAGNEAVHDAMEKGLHDAMEKGMAGLNDMTSNYRKNLEAMIASVTAAAKGAEALSFDTVAFSKVAMERQTAAVQSLASVRSLQDLMEVQTDLAKTHAEAYVAQMGKTTELMTSLFRAAFQPFNARMTAAVESVQSAR